MTTINLDTINWEDDYNEPDSGYDWAPAQVFIPTEDCLLYTSPSPRDRG